MTRIYQVPEERNASIFRVEEQTEQASSMQGKQSVVLAAGKYKD
jgi:hypothetical protein